MKTVSIAQRESTRHLAVNFQHRSSHLLFPFLNFSVDLDDCVNHNCSNGASCIDGINSYSCNCSAGFTGLNCETGRKRTNKTPMLLQKLNFTALVKLAVFINPVLLFVYIDDCVSQTCPNGASCVDGINTYSCKCTAGFTGWNCEMGRAQAQIKHVT